MEEAELKTELLDFPKYLSKRDKRQANVWHRDTDTLLHSQAF